MPEENRVGNKIRELREAQGLSASALAERGQTSAHVVEELESGELAPSLAPLLKLARGLGVPLGALLDDAPHDGPVVTRAGQLETEVRFSGIGPATRISTLDFHSLAPNKRGRHMEPFIIDVHPTVPDDCTLSTHEGEEFIYVLSGEIEVTWGKQRVQIGPGDSIYYDSETAHDVRAAGDADARILAVVYAPA